MSPFDVEFKFKCIHIFITNKPLCMKYYHILFFIMTNFPHCYDEDSMKKNTSYVLSSLSAPLHCLLLEPLFHSKFSMISFAFLISLANTHVASFSCRYSFPSS
jgi:hypothetical protein